MKQFVYILNALPKVKGLIDLDQSVVGAHSSEYKAQIMALKYDNEFPEFDHVITKVEVKEQKSSN